MPLTLNPSYMAITYIGISTLFFLVYNHLILIITGLDAGYIVRECNTWFEFKIARRYQSAEYAKSCYFSVIFNLERNDIGEH